MTTYMWKKETFFCLCLTSVTLNFFYLNVYCNMHVPNCRCVFQWIYNFFRFGLELHIWMEVVSYFDSYYVERQQRILSYIQNQIFTGKLFENKNVVSKHMKMYFLYVRKVHEKYLNKKLNTVKNVDKFRIFRKYLY